MRAGGVVITFLVTWKRVSRVHAYTFMLHHLILLVLLTLFLWCRKVVLLACVSFMVLVVVIVYVGVLVVVIAAVGCLFAVSFHDCVHRLVPNGIDVVVFSVQQQELSQVVCVLVFIPSWFTIGTQ